MDAQWLNHTDYMYHRFIVGHLLIIYIRVMVACNRTTTGYDYMSAAWNRQRGEETGDQLETKAFETHHGHQL